MCKPQRETQPCRNPIHLTYTPSSQVPKYAKNRQGGGKTKNQTMVFISDIILITATPSGGRTIANQGATTLINKYRCHFNTFLFLYLHYPFNSDTHGRTIANQGLTTLINKCRCHFNTFLFLYLTLSF